MNRYNFKNLKRVNKTTAKKLYNSGFDVLFIPCKLNPENNYFCMGIVENKFLESNSGIDFEKLENSFSYYNNRPDTGKYTAFYISTENTFLHFEFTNGSNPYIFRGSVLECKKELEKWGKRWNIETLKQCFYRLEEKTA